MIIFFTRNGKFILMIFFSGSALTVMMIHSHSIGILTYTMCDIYLINRNAHTKLPTIPHLPLRTCFFFVATANGEIISLFFFLIVQYFFPVYFFVFVCRHIKFFYTVCRSYALKLPRRFYFYDLWSPFNIIMSSELFIFSSQ